MKKLISIAAIILGCALFTACNTATAENSGKSRFEGLECVKNHTAEKVDFVNTFEDLENISELIVEGEFIDDSEIVYEEYSYNYSIQKDLLIRVVSSCPMKITKVYSGDAKVGDIINVLQEEGIHNDRFIAHTMLTPMQKGDEWVFCLGHSRSENYDGYWCVADHKGRYPSKNSASNEIMCFSDYPELGVYERSDFQEGFYNKLVEKYGI